MNNDFQLDLSNLSPELKLIFEIMKFESMSEDLILYGSVSLNAIDWDQFLKLVNHHRVFPSIYPKIKGINEKWIPPYVIKKLHQEYQKNTFKMLQLSGVSEQIAKLCLENNIRLLFLKGPLLAAELYGDISLRTSNDLDLLIPINKLEKMDKILIKLGYEKDESIQTILSDWKWRNHHFIYFHPKKIIKLEIHWRLNPGPAREPNFNDLWGRKRKSSLIRTPAYILGSEDLFLFLVSHGARHGWSRLRWLEDIYQLSRQSGDWKKTFKLLEKYQYLHVGGQALILTYQLFNASLNEEMKRIALVKRSRQLAQDAIFYIKQMVNLHTYPVPEEVSKYHSRHLFSLMSLQHKLLFIMTFLYPYPLDAETLPLPKFLHFLYFPLRPVLWVWRKIRKHALS